MFEGTGLGQHVVAVHLLNVHSPGLKQQPGFVIADYFVAAVHGIPADWSNVDCKFPPWLEITSGLKSHSWDTFVALKRSLKLPGPGQHMAVQQRTDTVVRAEAHIQPGWSMNLEERQGDCGQTGGTGERCWTCPESTDSGARLNQPLPLPLDFL